MKSRYESLNVLSEKHVLPLCSHWHLRFLHLHLIDSEWWFTKFPKSCDGVSWTCSLVGHNRIQNEFRRLELEQCHSVGTFSHLSRFWAIVEYVGIILENSDTAIIQTIYIMACFNIMLFVYDTLKYTKWVSTFAVYALPFRLYRIAYSIGPIRRNTHTKNTWSWFFKFMWA